MSARTGRVQVARTLTSSVQHVAHDSVHNGLLDGLATEPVVMELVLTETGPKLVPKTLEGLLLLRAVTRFPASTALLSRKANVSVTTTEPPL